MGKVIYGPSDRSGVWHWYPQAKENFDYNPKRTYAKSIEDMEKFLRYSIKKGKGLISFDIETTGLNPEEDYIVGFSFTGDEKYGMYVPVAHMEMYEEYNLGVSAVEKFLEIVFQTQTILVIYHAKFDAWFIELDMTLSERSRKLIGGIDFFDDMIGVFNLDTNHKYPSLKKSVLYFLGIVMDSFSTVTKGENQFHYLDPTDPSTLKYATDDAICLWMLHAFIVQAGKKERLDFIFKLDNKFEKKLIQIQQKKIYLDLNWANKLRIHYESKSKEIENYVYSVVGRKFNLGSGPQRAQVLLSLGLSTGVFSKKTKVMSTTMLLMEKLDHPVPKNVAKWMSTNKIISSYINPILANPTDWLRINYNIVDTASGRLSSSGDKKNSYFGKTNIQNWPKPKALDYFVFPIEEYADKEFQIDLFGKSLVPSYHFKLKDGEKTPPGCIGIVEGMDQRGNVRSTVIARPGKIIVGVDYNSEELVITANMTKEKAWLDIFRNKGDLHRKTAETIWGKENYNRDKRKIAKTVNFGVLYGMSAFRLAADLGVALAEGERIANSFLKGYKTLSTWLNGMKRLGRETGNIFTFFGRPRRVRYLYNDMTVYGKPKTKKQKGSDKASARNISTNHPIQGTGADIFKMAVIRLMDQVMSEYIDDEVGIEAMVHDEVVFEIDLLVLTEVLVKIREAMEFEIPGWQVQLSVGMDLGTKWGYMFPVLLSLEGVLTLDMEKV